LTGKVGFFCNDAFDKFVLKGDDVESNSSVTRIYKVAQANQRFMSLGFYISPRTNAMYVDDIGVQKMGEIIIAMDDTSGGLRREVQVSMFFGKSEVTITAIEGTSKKRYEAFIKFDGKAFDYNGPKLEAESKPVNNYHIIFANDISSSMWTTDTQPSIPFIKEKHNDRVGTLYEACYSFLKAREGTSDLVTCVLHESTAYPIFNILPVNPDSLIKDYMLHYGKVCTNGLGYTGGNDFKDAMKKIRDALSKNPPGYIPIALFMTDGVWQEDGASEELTSIMDTYRSTGFTLHTIGLGPQVNRVLMQKFATIGNGTFSVSSINLADFKSKYVALAGLLE